MSILLPAPEKEKATMATVHFFGDARQWYRGGFSLVGRPHPLSNSFVLLYSYLLHGRRQELLLPPSFFHIYIRA